MRKFVVFNCLNGLSSPAVEQISVVIQSGSQGIQFNANIQVACEIVITQEFVFSIRVSAFSFHSAGNLNTL
jgi:hypothetical protein